MDTGTISQSTIRKSLKLSLLPKKPLKKLKIALEQILIDYQKATRVELSSNDFKKLKELRIREEFLRFVCSIMTNYTDFLTPISKPIDKKNATDVRVLFDVESFVKSKDRNAQDFYQRFTATQTFIRFIEERELIVWWIFWLIESLLIECLLIECHLIGSLLIECHLINCSNWAIFFWRTSAYL